MRRILFIVLLCGALAACASKSSNGSSSAPAGVDQSIWDDYCSHGAALASYLQQAQNGTLTNAEFTSKLEGSENGIAGDATATKPPISDELQALADSIGRAKVAVSTGDTPDYQAILTAASALPACK